MRDTDYVPFCTLLDQVCTMLGKGQHKPDAQSSAIWFRVLGPYTIDQVRAGFDAHVRCPDRGRFVPVPADIIAKIHSQDGRPTADEAWGIAVRALDESLTVTWTDEIAEAWGIARPIHDAGDEIGARLAFRDAYRRVTEQAKRAGRAANWWPTLGHDATGREPEVQRAATAGLLEHSAALMLAAPDDQTLNRVAAGAPPHVRDALLALRSKLAAPAVEEQEPAPMPTQHRTPARGARGPDLMTLGIVAVKQAELSQ
jgi:hypothetical protein